MRAQLAALDETLKAHRVAVQEAQDRRTHIEIHLVQLQSDLKHLDEECAERFGFLASELVREDDPGTRRTGAERAGCHTRGSARTD